MQENTPGAVSDLSAHLVFVVKYRRRALTAEILTRCETIISDTAATLGVTIVEINGEADHLHLLIDYPPKHSIATIAGRPKGATARKLRLECGAHLSKYLWGGHLWTDSYFAASTGGASLSTVKRYITNQNRPE